jgi:NodT family efflux transporter outer membrane factor (OMF) lipoprotein
MTPGNLLRMFVLAAWFSLAGCATRQAPSPLPAPSLPQQWSTPANATVGDARTWWKNFADPQLDALIEEALRKNNDLTAAAIRGRLAQLQAGLVNLNRNPGVSVSANSSISRSFDPAMTSRSSGLNASASLEVDLWGKLDSQRAAAALGAQASREDCQDFAATLAVTTAKLYWQIAYLSQLVSLSEADIAYAQKTLDTVRTKQAAGALSALNVTQSELNLSSLQAAHTQLVQQRLAARHAMAILFDQPPETAVAERAALPEAPLPAIAAGLPAAILGKRPDLRAAELRLRESLANVDATRTSFYPTLTLTGSVGTASSALADFLKNPVATLGAGLALPFVQWNTRQLSIRVSETQYEEAVVNFRQRLYAALAEVEDGLSARTQLMLEGDKLALAVTQARRAEALAESRYLAGATEAQLWLDAQAARRNSERFLLANRFSQLGNQASLYRALGMAGMPEQSSCSRL